MVFAVAVASLLAVACEKVLEVDEPANRQMVLNAVPTAGQRAFVNFSYTRFFLDSSNFHPVDGADIVLDVNGQRMRPDSVSRCNYFFPHILQEGDSLSISIDAAGHRVQAHTYVPLIPDVDSMVAVPFVSPSFNFLTVSFTLSDHPDMAEYYSIAVKERDSGARFNEWTQMLDTVDTVYTTYFLVPYNPEITSNEVNPYIPLGGYLYSRIMFLDRLIDGQSPNIQLYIMQLVDTNEVEPFKHEYFVDVESMTRERFRYQLSVATQNSMTSFFAEQGQAYSNVEVDGATGLGVFAGNAKRRFHIDESNAVTPVSQSSFVPDAHLLSLFKRLRTLQRR